MEPQTTPTTSNPQRLRPPVTLDSNGRNKPYGDFSGMANDYRLLSRKSCYSTVPMGITDYDGPRSQYQKPDTSSRLTDEQLREFIIPEPAMTLKDLAKSSSFDETLRGSTVAPSSPTQNELLATSFSHLRIGSREEVAERERQAIIQEFQRNRARFNNDYWPKRKADALSDFDRARTLKLQAEFRKVIDRPVLARAETTQKHRAATAGQRADLIRRLEHQRDAEWYLERQLFGEKLRAHYAEYSDLYQMNVNTALATWIVEAGLD